MTHQRNNLSTRGIFQLLIFQEEEESVREGRQAIMAKNQRTGRLDLTALNFNFKVKLEARFKTRCLHTDIIINLEEITFQDTIGQSNFLRDGMSRHETCLMEHA